MTTRKLIAAAVLSATLVAPAAARGSAASADPVIFGAGRIDAVETGGAAYRCTSTVLNNVNSSRCPAANLDAGDGQTAILTLRATPRSTGGWRFAGWNNCPQPQGTSCIVSAFSMPGVDTVVFEFPVVRFVDEVAPVVSPVTHAFLAGDNQVRFDWTVDDVATFTCRMDGGPAQACTTGKTFTLDEGTHTLAVRATDAAGNVAATDATSSVRVVDTRLVSGPRPFEPARTAAFRIGSGAGLSFECRLTKPAQAAPAFAGCGAKGADGTLTVPFAATALAQDGQYTFEARARDGGDVDQTPLKRTWTVDTVPPDTTLISPDISEAGVTTLPSAAFRYLSSEPGTLQCSLDGAPFSTCTSPRSISGLAVGPHTFQVRAVDRAGNADPTPAVRHWTLTLADRDGDGFDQRRDCDDADPKVNPGARDIRGNGKDEDCDGKDAARLRVTGSVTHNWSFQGPAFTLIQLQATGLLAGSKLQLRCLGDDCPISRLRVKGRPRAGKVNLLKALAGRRRHFRAGQTLEVRITAPHRNGTVVRYKLKAGRTPVGRPLCLPPGAKNPRRRC